MPKHQIPSATQVLVEAASALHGVMNHDAPPWTELPEQDRVDWAAYVAPSVLAVLMTTKPEGWGPLFGEITAMSQAWVRANTPGGES